MKQNKTLSMLGLATRAGKVVSGEFSVEKAVRGHKAKLVILAEDCSANTRKHFEDMCRFHEVPLIYSGDKESLGHAIGSRFRASAAVLEEGFAARIKEIAEQEPEK